MARPRLPASTLRERAPESQLTGATRAVVAIGLVALLSAVVISFISIWAGSNDVAYRDGAVEFFPIVISSITGLVGAVVGYYFRQEERG